MLFRSVIAMRFDGEGLAEPDAESTAALKYLKYPFANSSEDGAGSTGRYSALGIDDTPSIEVHGEFEVDGDIDNLTPDAALALYRILQEGLRNVARHAAAQQITVRLRGEPSSVEIEIADDGAGFDPAAPAGSPGDRKSTRLNSSH